MNRKRRTVLQIVLDNLERLREPIENSEALSIVEDALKRVENCMDDEQDALDNMPESLQMSAQATDMEDNVNDMSSALCDLECIQTEYDSADVPIGFETIKSDFDSVVNALIDVINR